MGINYYSILNLKKHCTTEDVIISFGKLVSKYSMINQVQDHSLIILCETFEVLSDPFRRALYDKYGEEGIKKGIQCDSLCIDPWVYHADVITTYLQYCVLKNPITRLCLKSKDAVLVNFKKIKRHPEIIRSNLKLTLNEIFYGSMKLVPIKRKSKYANDLIPNEVQFVKVKIPCGFPTGKTLTSEELNADTDFDGIKTIYIFTIKEIPHKHFKRDNMNLIMVKNISLKQAFCGIKININTLDNKVIRVNITQVVTCDYVKIIHNEGMPNVNNPMERGDVIIKFDIIYPLYLPIMNEACELFNNNQMNT